VKDCQAEAGYHAATGLAVMTVAAGAGATVSGPTFMSSPVGDAVVAGAGAGAITGTVLNWSGQQRFERAWVACMESRGYTVVQPEQAQVPPCDDEALRLLCPSR